MTLALVLTDAGQQAIVDEDNAGTLPVTLSEIALGTGQWTPDATATGLQAEFKRLSTISGGVVVADDMLHITLRDESGDSYTVSEFGVFTDSGALYAIYSVGPGGDPVATKAADSTYLLSLDIKLAGGQADNISVGDTGFSNPPATTAQAGAIELATQSEVDAGSDAARAVTPKTLATRLQAFAAAGHGHSYASTSADGFVRLATQAEVTSGTQTSKVVTPKTLQKKIEDNRTPAATTTTAGAAEIATQTETDAGADDARIVTPKKLAAFFNKMLPNPIIYIWGGTIAEIPTGFKLCNGANNTHDLRDRFVIGAGDTYSVGATGGSTSATTSNNGAHSHGITVNNHTLTTSQMPSHRHHHDLGRYKGPNGSGGSQSAWILDYDSGTWDNRLDTYTKYTGGGGAHNHTASATSSGGHTHTVAILPPFYALAYIQRV